MSTRPRTTGHDLALAMADELADLAPEISTWLRHMVLRDPGAGDEGWRYMLCNLKMTTLEALTPPLRERLAEFLAPSTWSEA